MDPVSALGIAAACVQFIDFGIKAVTLCNQIRSSSQNATKNQEELMFQAEAVRQLQSQLSLGVQEAKDHSDVLTSRERRIQKTASDCNKTAIELLQLLSKIQGKDASALTKAKAFLKSLKGKSEIDSLHKKLKARQNALNMAISVDMRKQLDILARDQRSNFAGLRESLDSHVEQHAMDVSRLEKTVHKSTESNQFEFRKLSQAFSDFSSEVRQSRSDFAATSSPESHVLQSLSFPEMHAREETIRPAYTSTFDWALEGQPDNDQSWVPISKWLQGDEQMYWICGKAGSGKSTLMALLFHDQRMTSILHERSRRVRRPWQLCSFFFWRAGSLMQKSITGLLRSLLHQIVISRPDCEDHLRRSLNLKSWQVPVWSIQTCMKALRSILVSQQEVCDFVFLIDGLDEFDGPLDDLLDLIMDELNTSENCRFLLSSRPEQQLKDRLGGYSSLRLEQLNYGDIYTFVTGKLGKQPHLRLDVEVLGEKITNKAEGIFLWAALGVQELIRGHADGDDVEVMMQRLEEIPRGLEQIYDYMLANLDKGHLQYLARLICIVQCIQNSFVFLNASVLLITPMICGQQGLTISQFIEEGKRIRRQISGRSRGLLEVNCPLPSLDETMHLPSLANVSDDSKWPSDGYALRAVARSRLVRPSTRNDMELLDLGRQNIVWIHRSAYDFIMEQDSTDLFKCVSAQDSSNVRKEIWHAGLSRLVMIGSTDDEPLDKRPNISLATRIRWLLNDLSDQLPAEDQLSGEGVDMFNSIREVVIALDPSEIWPVTIRNEMKTINSTLTRAWLLSVLGSYMRSSYLRSQGAELLKQPYSHFTAVCLLYGLDAYSFEGSKALSLRERIMKKLTEQSSITSMLSTGGTIHIRPMQLGLLWPIDVCSAKFRLLSCRLTQSATSEELKTLALLEANIAFERVEWQRAEDEWTISDADYWPGMVSAQHGTYISISDLDSREIQRGQARGSIHLDAWNASALINRAWYYDDIRETRFGWIGPASSFRLVMYGDTYRLTQQRFQCHPPAHASHDFDYMTSQALGIYFDRERFRDFFLFCSGPWSKERQHFKDDTAALAQICMRLAVKSIQADESLSRALKEDLLRLLHQNAAELLHWYDIEAVDEMDKERWTEEYDASLMVANALVAGGEGGDECDYSEVEEQIEALRIDLKYPSPLTLCCKTDDDLLQETASGS